MVALRIEPQIGIKTWIAVFVQADRSTGFYWWQLLTGRKWAHVWVMGLSDCGYVVINPRGNHMYVEHFLSSVDPYSFLTAACIGQEVMGAVEIDLPVDISFRTNFHMVYSCVSVVKDILNVRKWWILTPRQLYHHLSKVGQVIPFDRVSTK